MKMKSLALSVRTAVAAIAVVAGSSTASAAIVFQSVPNLADTSKFTSSWCSGCGTSGYRIFDKFTLSNSVNITGFSVDLYSISPYWGQGLNFSIWSSLGNQPQNQIFNQNFSNSDFTTTALSSDALLASTEKVVGLNLNAGTYYVSFYNTNLAVWGYQGGGGNLYQQGIGYRPGTSAAFILTGNQNNAVPEPSSLALVGLALAAGVASSRRRRTQVA